jgi:hypothetical protein
MPTDPNPQPDTCNYPGCNRPRKKGRGLCAQHALEADRAAARLAEQERRQGWPPSQMESGDA